ncbi:MAG: stage II sporulation protein P, partial [Firmicutes bacterium]|nr:stage II sporulation protein P [Bacillota bacterium]
LKAEGIAAVHDQTLHDSPSYNQSYSRSYTTITEILKKYPTIKCVIDLHRDAIASDSPAATVSVSGKTCARYSYVVSNAVPTYSDNLTFINAMNETASEEYSGFTGKILERGYRYNQDLSSKYMLLEIGYNRNRIEDARNTAEVFAKILADTLKAGH